MFSFLKNVNYWRLLLITRYGKLKKLEKCPNSDDDFIVSMTSYGDRLKTCHLAIRSLLRQSVLPNRIQLYIGKESRDISLSKQLLELQKYGLEIYRDVDDLKGHKKYFYCMNCNPRNRIITVDDDCIYDKNTIHDLIVWGNKFPDAVIARRTHRISVTNGSIEPYNAWDFEWCDSNPVPRKLLIAIGVGGVLYPRHFATDDLLNENEIVQNALYCDDIWLKCYEIYKGIKVVSVPSKHPHPLQIKKTIGQGLKVRNLGSNGNDVSIIECMRHFNLNTDSFIGDSKTE